MPIPFTVVVNKFDGIGWQSWLNHSPLTALRRLTPLFSPQSDERALYGSDSVFVRATSDLFTNAVVTAMKANNLLVSEDTIALFACEEAEETLRSLVKAVDGSKTLLQEACGVAPVGSFSKLVDSTFEEGCFSTWLREFEAEQFAVASGIIGRSK